MRRLLVSNEDYRDLARRLCGSGTLWVSDSFNMSWVVESCGMWNVVLPNSSHVGSRLVAVGGCSARDRCAVLAQKWNVPWVYIPSILSTDCLSVNRAVVYENGQPRSVIVPRPEKVYLNFPLLRSGGQLWLNWWCAAGMGDLLAGISASIHCNPSAMDYNVLTAVPAASYAYNWLAIGPPPKWTDLELERFARFLMYSSQEVVRKGDTSLSAAGEHDLCYALRQKYFQDPVRYPHGLLVSIGTLLTVSAYCTDARYYRFRDTLRRAYSHAGLPADILMLGKYGISREQVLDGLQLIPPESYLAQSFRKHGSWLFDCSYGYEDCF